MVLKNGLRDVLRPVLHDPGVHPFDSGIVPTLEIPLISNLNTLRASAAPTFTRASTGWSRDSDGNWSSKAVDAPRFHFAADGIPLGLWIEGARTNNALQSRDFTNAAWVKTNITAAKDAAGIDGSANSASTLTADAGNGTAFQTVTIGSAAYATSFYVKRKTGTGTIEITDNNGTNYTDITSLINSSTWTLVEILRTQANPVFGFRIVTSGDEIEVDMAGLEAGTFPSSPIPTTTIAVTRAQDFLTYAVGTWFNHDGAGSCLYDVYIPFRGNSHVYQVSFDDDSSSDRYSFNRQSGLNTQYAVIDGGAVQAQILPSGQWSDDQNAKIGLVWATNDFEFVLDGVSEGTDTAGTLPSGIFELKIGRQYNDSNSAFECFKNFRYYNTRLLSAQLLSLTS